MPPNPFPKKDDLFISYNSADIIWAEWIIYTIEQAGYKVIPLSWNAFDFIDHMQGADRKTKYTMIIWSSAYRRMLEGKPHWHKEFDRRKLTGRRKCIPVLIQASELVGPLVVNLVGIDDESRTQDRLLEVLKKELGRRTPLPLTNPPKLPPLFPGSRWNVPIELNPYFIDRDEKLTGLYRAFIEAKEREPSTSVQPQALTGPTGIGKTQIAVKYAYQNRSHYRYVFWIEASSRSNLLDGFRHIASIVTSLNLVLPNDQELINKVKSWLKDESDALLVLDHCDALPEDTLAEFIPRSSKSHILLTTCAGFIANATTIRIDGLDHTDGARLLLRQAEKGDPSGEELTKADDFSKEVAGFPPALLAAGNEIRQTGCTVPEFLRRYKAKEERIKFLQKSYPDYPTPILAIWLTSFDKISQNNPSAANLLKHCAFLYHDAIPIEIIDEPGIDLNESIRYIRGFSLIHRHDSIVSVHPLLQVVIRDINMQPSERRDYTKETANKFVPLLPSLRDELNVQKYILHAEACAEIIMGYDKSEMCSQAVADLLDIVGRYKTQQLDENAGKYLERALEIRRDLANQPTVGTQA